MADIETIHVRGDDGQHMCGQPGDSITLAEAHDPDDGRDFTCGRCWAVLAGGREPMGGNRT